MIKAIAGGTSFLNTFPTIQKKVMIVDDESGDWELKRRVELLLMNHELPIFFHCLNGFKLDKPDSVTSLVKHCKELEVGMVALDPFVSMHSGEENSATEMQKVMEAMQQFTVAGMTVMFIHHSRKGGFGSGAQNSRGSSAIHGRADSMLSIEKVVKGELEYISLQHVKSRRGKAAESARIIMNQPQEDGPIELIYDGNAYEMIIKKDKARDVILDVLKEGGLKRANLIELAMAASKIGKSNVISAIKELEEDGLIFLEKKGRENEYSISQVPIEMEE
jgi:predicted transcriptional regulator